MINGVSNSVHAAAQPAGRERGPARPGNTPAGQQLAGSDAVELSPIARERIDRSGADSIRTKLVERIRAEIAAGTYLTDDKLDAAVSHLHDEMFAAV